MNEIQMVAKLYNCRDTAKLFFREEYATKLEPYKQIVEKVMNDNKIDAIPAVLLISKTESYKENGFGQMMFMAAVVEIIEGEKS